MSSNPWLSASNAILGAYGLIPLMINFAIHAYIALRSPATLFQRAPCPNCNHVPQSAVSRRWNRHIALPADDNDNDHSGSAPGARQQHRGRAQSAGPGHSRSSKEIYAHYAPREPFLHAYDGDARESSEFQTSGFNTPRQSEETLRSEVRGSREGWVDRKDVGSLV
jgi:hypothetical protein